MKSNDKKLTKKQQCAADGIKRRMEETGVPFPTAGMVADAHLEAYDVHASGKHTARDVAAIVGANNLKKPHFLAALGLESQQVKEFVGSEIMRNIEGKTHSSRLTARCIWIR